jgi:dUTP pyrophosphatase
MSPFPTHKAKLLVKRNDPRAVLPTRAHDDDVGFDLYTLADSEIPVAVPGSPTPAFRDVATGLAIELPFGLWGRIVGRSSTIRKRGLYVVEGTIDPGFRGELYVGVINMTGLPVFVAAGERLGQFIPTAVPYGGGCVWEIEETASLSDSARGEKGFGSSGR